MVDVMKDTQGVIYRGSSEDAQDVVYTDSCYYFDPQTANVMANVSGAKKHVRLYRFIPLRGSMLTNMTQDCFKPSYNLVDVRDGLARLRSGSMG